MKGKVSLLLRSKRFLVVIFSFLLIALVGFGSNGFIKLSAKTAGLGHVASIFTGQSIKASTVTGVAPRQTQSTSYTKCGGAPFIWPTYGKRGWIYNDVNYETDFDGNGRHDGLDIKQVGNTEDFEPIYAVYGGYITAPNDYSLKLVTDTIGGNFDVPDRDVTVYYTHMASPSRSTYIEPKFRNANHVRVEQGELLGKQGSYGANGLVHLHISVNAGYYESSNIDPSKYFGDELNYNNGARESNNAPSFNCSYSAPQSVIK